MSMLPDWMERQRDQLVAAAEKGRPSTVNPLLVTAATVVLLGAALAVVVHLTPDPEGQQVEVASPPHVPEPDPDPDACPALHGQAPWLVISGGTSPSCVQVGLHQEIQVLNTTGDTVTVTVRGVEHEVPRDGFLPVRVEVDDGGRLDLQSQPHELPEVWIVDPSERPSTGFELTSRGIGPFEVGHVVDEVLAEWGLGELVDHTHDETTPCRVAYLADDPYSPELVIDRSDGTLAAITDTYPERGTSLPMWVQMPRADAEAELWARGTDAIPQAATSGSERRWIIGLGQERGVATELVVVLEAAVVRALTVRPTGSGDPSGCASNRAAGTTMTHAELPHPIVWRRPTLPNPANRFTSQGSLLFDPVTGSEQALHTPFGEEDRARLAVDWDRGAVFYSRVITGCFTEAVRVRFDGPGVESLGAGVVLATSRSSSSLVISVPSETADRSCHYSDLVILDLEGIEPDRLLPSLAADVMHIGDGAWHPDGRHLVIAVSREDSVSLVRIDTWVAESVDDGVELRTRPHDVNPDRLAFLGDGTLVVADSTGELAELLMLDPMTGDTVGSLGAFDGVIEALSVAPDGRSIAITTDRGLFLYRDGNVVLVRDDIWSAGW